jgi:D-alanyl-D-alanine carboxypeptidase/D-alanyl-D-alanine-endopeptidase (penicillin-binding protein 4)
MTPVSSPAGGFATRRTVVARLSAAVAALTAPRLAGAQAGTPEAATPVTPSPAAPLPDEITAIITSPRYDIARWGIYVADRETGETIYDLRGDERFLAASTTKLYPTATALHAYGADYQFETPVYRTGPVGEDGALAGDLVLVASGDPTMGGRTTADGQIAYTPIDHIYANVFPALATLTPENPLAGLDDLAQQVAAAGITHVAGDVLIDARLFPEMAKDGYILSPIWINDNLVDLVLTPGAVGEPATLTWRPETAAFAVQSAVQTVAADEPLQLSVTSPSPGVIAVSGELPVNVPQAVQTSQVPDPAAFARSLLIEALGRAGVTVEAAATGPNQADLLPPSGSYAADNQVAVFTSPPFAENIKLINKVSMNQHADMLIFLLALKAGETSFDAGLAQIPPFLRDLGLDPDLISLSDGRGNVYTDLFSPRSVSQLLQAMARHPDFQTYFDSLPILGVDGSETETVSPTSPVAGKGYAKSGTTVDGDVMNQRPLAMVRALAGYMTAKSGRELIFALYVSDVPLADPLDVLNIITEQGAIAEIIYNHN